MCPIHGHSRQSVSDRSTSMSRSLRSTLQRQPRKRVFEELNDDVSNPRRCKPSAHFNPGKPPPNSERTNTDEITIHVVFRSSGKPAVAHAAHVMANDPKWQQQQIGIRDINAILEGVSWWFPKPPASVHFYFRRPWTPFAGPDYRIQYLPVLTPAKATARVVWIPSLADNPYRIPVRSQRFLTTRCLPDVHPT